MKIASCALALAACNSNATTRSDTNFTDGGEDRLAPAGVTHWSFDDGMPPEMFNVLGNWVVHDGELVQGGEHAVPDYPRMLIEDLSVTDFHLSVECKAAIGDIDRACGLLFRAVDSENYFITRANSREDNIRLYRIIDGVRIKIASADVDIDGDWHTLAVDARGAHIEVLWNGKSVLAADDETFTRGAIGVWTKADSFVRFDDLVLEVE